jgi:hypothetical protein
LLIIGLANVSSFFIFVYLSCACLHIDRQAVERLMDKSMMLSVQLAAAKESANTTAKRLADTVRCHTCLTHKSLSLCARSCAQLETLCYLYLLMLLQERNTKVLRELIVRNYCAPAPAARTTVEAKCVTVRACPFLSSLLRVLFAYIFRPYSVRCRFCFTGYALTPVLCL